MSAKQIDEVGGRRSNGLAAPFGQREKVQGTAEAVGDEGCQLKQTVEGDLKLREAVDGFGIAHLTFGDTNEGFFVAVIALNLPTIDIGLEKRLDRQSGIGADQKSGIAIQQLGTFAKTITDGLDHNEPKRTMTTGFAPEEVVDDFDLESTQFTSGKTLNGNKGNGFVAQGFKRCGSRRTKATGASLFARNGRDRKTEFGIFANAAEQNGVVRKLRQNGAIGIGAIDRNEQGPMGQGRALIEGGAKGLDNAGADIGEAELFAELFIFFAFGVRSLLARFAWELGGLKANRQSTSRAGLRGINDQRSLNETKAANEVHAILGSERIAPGRDSRNPESGFAEDGVIHGDDDRHRIGSQEAQGTVDDGIEETSGIPGTARKESVVGGPI